MTQSILITGGAGFIGVNAASHFASSGWRVTVLDNLCRRGSAENLSWLRDQVKFDFVEADVRDAALLQDLMQRLRPTALLHLAGQVAVTTSVTNPRADFESNALGTFNALEAVRIGSPETVFLNASTNKVYGKLAGFDAVEGETRYSLPAWPQGVPETAAVDFHSPYGCSKGAADQYVIDYARIYDLRTFTFRQSCIYGLRQMGVEDQGWVAWFTIAAVLDREVVIYGDGKQVRDLLWVEDLIELYEKAIADAEHTGGIALNAGGGPANTLSLRELIAHLEERLGRPLCRRSATWRPGDQRIYVSDIRRASELLDWRPTTSVGTGLDRLLYWVRANRPLFESFFPAS